MKENQEESEIRPIVVMNFTHVYEQESFYQNEAFKWIDCTDISGIYGYCDSEATRQICNKIKYIPVHGIHFIDSGNFHYVSKFWMDKITEPFVLVLFDHHTDMMESRFGDLLSCGSWAREALDHNPFLKNIVLIGADQSLVTNVEEKYRQRVKYFSTSYFNNPDNRKTFSEQHAKIPLYISVDKDVLNAKEEPTDWDQGTMSVAMLENILNMLMSNHRILGVDITGESTNLLSSGQKEIHMNDIVNQKLLHIL